MSNTAPRSLQHNALWAFLGQASHLGCQWLVLTMFARWGGADAAGLFALGLAVCAPAFVMANLQLRELHVSDVQKEFRFHERLALRLFSLGVAFLGVVGTALVITDQPVVLGAIIAVALAKSVESIADLGYAALQVHERFPSIALSQILRALVGLASSAAVYATSGSVPLSLSALALGWFATTVVFDFTRVRTALAPDQMIPAITRTRLKTLALQALPLGLVGGIGTVTLMFPSYIIQHTLGTDALGHFTAVAYLPFIGSVAVLALGQSANPRMARALAAGDRGGFVRLILLLWLVVLGLGLSGLAIIWTLGDMILGVLYGAEWRAHTPLLLWLTAASMIQWLTTILGFATTTARRLVIQIPIGLLACAVSGVTSGWFIPAHGLLGAVGSMALTFAALMICHAVVLIIHLRPGKTA